MSPRRSASPEPESESGRGAARSRYWWLLPATVVIAVGALVWAIVTSVSNGTFL